MLFTLIRNEIRKILRRGKTWVVFALFATFLILLAIGNNIGEKSEQRFNAPERRIESIEHQIAYQKENLTSKEKSLSADEYSKLKTETEKRIQSLEEQKKSFEEIKADPSKSENLWKVKLDNDILGLEEELKDNSIPDQYKTNLQNELKNLKYLKDHNIKPMNRSEFTSYNYFAGLLKILGVFMLGIGLAIFMSDIVSGECTPATLKFLLIQPVSRGKVLFSKFISVILTSLGMILSLEAIAFLAIGIFKGFGNPDYPMNFGTKYAFDLGNIKDGANPLIEVANSTSMIPLSSFTLKAVLLQCLFIVACCSFIFMISTLVKSSMISMAISTATLIGCSILNQAVGQFRKISFLFFPSYGDSSSLLDGSISVFFNKPNVTMQFGIIVMIAWIIGCYLISHIIFSKKDILI
ncbi:ABC-2 type transport system permease protein [Clostridium cavendishii DSM 21758]|uniref:ABC-2 type transport system permease protein n=1 Tax=Clostridium cavendishii DSM 21758 TaxID=1121302 RepID=A0A1M6MKX0_9CLOT|nr:ABC transporter permease subunit [Clostridium cavendishii]SHJ84099.1 ABC-2 type transport system permease protein [Clostridium cavendishii DSM 21758]